MPSPMASVDCQLPSGRCSTKPRSTCTGPPKWTGASRSARSASGNVDLLEQRRQRHVDRLVHDDAERTVLVVLAHIGQRVRKIGIRHGRHGDEEVVREVDRPGHQRRIVIRRGWATIKNTSGHRLSCDAGCFAHFSVRYLPLDDHVPSASPGLQNRASGAGALPPGRLAGGRQS